MYINIYAQRQHCVHINIFARKRGEGEMIILTAGIIIYPPTCIDVNSMRSTETEKEVEMEMDLNNAYSTATK